MLHRGSFKDQSSREQASALNKIGWLTLQSNSSRGNYLETDKTKQNQDSNHQSQELQNIGTRLDELTGAREEERK